MVLKATANDKHKNLAPCHDEFCGPSFDVTVDQRHKWQHEAMKCVTIAFRNNSSLRLKTRFLGILANLNSRV
ncbi:hypothetical protein TNCV_1305911 [Trichonephila clavipes]|nr:hypothetical protein TNCV_1305911 [Trichonephila clavipes]